MFILLAGVALGVQSARKAGFSNAPDAGEKARWNDLRVFYGAGRYAFRQVDIYKTPTSEEGRFYIIPPFFAIVCAPVAALGWKAFYIIWFIISFVGIAASAALCVKIAQPGAKREGLILLSGLVLLLCARPVISDFQNGQVNSLIFTMVAVSLFLFVRKQDAASGIIMALAASIKMTAGIFLLYFLLKGAFKTAGGMVLALAFTLVLLPMLCFGPSRASNLYSSFYGRMVEPFTSVTDAPEVYSEAGQSLRAAAGRYLTDTNAAHHTDYEIKVNFASLPEDTVWKMVLAGCVALIIATALCARANPANKERRDLTALELGAVLLLMLMVSPMSRKAHFVALLLPFAAGVGYLMLYRSDPQRRSRWRIMLVTLAGAFVVFNLTSPDVVGKRQAALLLAYSSFFFATFALWVASCLILAGPKRRARAVSGDVGPQRTGTHSLPKDST